MPRPAMSVTSPVCTARGRTISGSAEMWTGTVPASARSTFETIPSPRTKTGPRVAPWVAISAPFVADAFSPRSPGIVASS